MRSWLGSFKQLSNSIEGYTVLLAPLELMVGNRSSAEHIVWTDALSQSFDRAKKSLRNIKTVFVPKPSDKLHTFSDYSKANGAVGGRMEIHRLDDKGVIQKLHGGDFSCRVSNHQKNWFACEGEALAVKLVIEHYSRYLRENKNTIIHHTDNMPVVQAWKRSKGGSYSSSARISTFLSEISVLDIEIIHTPGKELKSSDFNSRHPNDCNGKRCQICKFAFELEDIGDRTIPMVGNITVLDILQGKASMPFNQKPAWLKAQKSDPTHQKLCWLIDNSQTPDKKKTRGDNTRLKLLHNLYANGSLTKAGDGLITVLHTDSDGGTSRAISVPYAMYPGLVQALHLKFNHPSKNQLQKMCSKYFYTPGHTAIIDDVTESCNTCARLKQLPPEMFSESTAHNKVFGSNFSADIIRREGQKILLIREKLSQFTLTTLVPDEKADSLRDGLFCKILELIPTSGATVQVDNAPGFQTLKAENDCPGSLLHKFHIRIETGRTLNINKNPIAENGIKEFHKECLRIQPSGGPLSTTDLVTITKTMNERIRDRGFSAKEILLQRDQVSNGKRPISDELLGNMQNDNRTKKHPQVKPLSKSTFKIGQNVMLRNGKTKVKGREMYKITDIFERDNEYWARIQKHESQFRSKEYEAKFTEIIPTTDQFESETHDTHTKDEERKHQDSTDNDIHIDQNATEYRERPPRQAAVRAREKIKQMSACSTLQVRKIKEKPPTHAWDYETFRIMAEQESTTKNKPRYHKTKETTQDDFDSEDPTTENTDDQYLWDDSPEQFTLHQRNNVIHTRHSPVNDDTSDDMNYSLTEVPSSDDDVFHNSSPKSRSARFKRVPAIRKRRIRRTLSFTHLPSSDMEDSSENLAVTTMDSTPHNSLPKIIQQNSARDRLRSNLIEISHPRSQDKTHDTNAQANPQVYPISHRRPHRPTDVQLGPQVQNLNEPLETIQDLIVPYPHRTRIIRRTRSDLDYVQLHNHGTKQPRR